MTLKNVKLKEVEGASHSTDSIFVCVKPAENWIMGDTLFQQANLHSVLTPQAQDVGPIVGN